LDPYLLEIIDLRTYFYTEEGIVKAVDGVNFNIKSGEILGLVGESGCGKSVTAYSIIRLIESPPGDIVHGQIFFEGEDLLRKKESEMRKVRGDKVSMIFQDPMVSLNPVYTVGEQISENLRLHQKLNKKAATAKAIEMMDLVKIPEPSIRVYDYPHQFSGGMRQRIMIAMAISCNPSLLIADEPTTALDVTIQAQILQLLIELKEKLNTSILLITHDLGVVAEICSKVAVMYCGKIVEFSSVGEIFKNPFHPYTESLLRSIPRLDETRENLDIIKGSVPSLVAVPPGCIFHPRCLYTKEICKKEKAPGIQVKEDHFVSCFKYT
jgi:peptide/nickel transport system ATP-binding protein/oligopeptide transport system ATP-binding protein